MASYEIETYAADEGDDCLGNVRILSGDDGILENSGAMAAVERAIRKEFGENAETEGRGSSYFDSRGREAGWEWRVIDAAEMKAWRWACGNQGFDGTFGEWLDLDDAARAEYEAGAAGKPTA